MHHQGGNVAIRKWTVVASLALCAALALTVASVGSAKPSKAQATSGLKVALVTDIGGLNDKSFNALAYKGLKRAEKKLGIDGRVFLSKSSADYIPNLSTGGAELRPRHRRRVPDGRPARGRREAVPGHEVRDRRLPAAALKGKPKNARGLVFAEQEAGCLAGVAAATVSKCGRDRLGRRPEDPAGRRVHRRVPVLREEGQRPSITTPQRLLAGLRRPGKCKELALNADPARFDGVFAVAGRLRPRGAPGGEGAGASGASASTTTSLPRPAHPHERDEEGRRRGLRHDRVAAEGLVRGRRRHALRRRRTAASATAR